MTEISDSNNIFNIFIPMNMLQPPYHKVMTRRSPLFTGWSNVVRSLVVCT